MLDKGGAIRIIIISFNPCGRGIEGLSVRGPYPVWNTGECYYFTGDHYIYAVAYPEKGHWGNVGQIDNLFKELAIP